MPDIRDGYRYERTAGNGAANGDTNNGDRAERALNEPFWTFQDCYYRERNKGLYTADRLNPNNEDQLRAITTRQNPNGNRHGLECPEERDYYPYWHPTPWRDVAVITDTPDHCDFYRAASQNVEDYGRCWDKTGTSGTRAAAPATSGPTAIAGRSRRVQPRVPSLAQVPVHESVRGRGDRAQVCLP